MSNTSENKEMLDENIRVLTRRINDMEIECTEKGEKIKRLERTNSETQSKLDTIYDEQMEARQGLDNQYRIRLEERDRDINSLKEKIKTSEHRAACELDVIK